MAPLPNVAFAVIETQEIGQIFQAQSNRHCTLNDRQVDDNLNDIPLHSRNQHKVNSMWIENARWSCFAIGKSPNFPVRGYIAAKMRIDTEREREREGVSQCVCNQSNTGQIPPFRPTNLPNNTKDTKRGRECKQNGNGFQFGSQYHYKRNSRILVVDTMHYDSLQYHFQMWS